MSESLFAEIGYANVVQRVLSVPEEQRERGSEYLSVDLGLGGEWIETCRFTHHGQHEHGGTPLRMNYAGRGYVYDEALDAFIPPQPFPSWTLDEEICDWVPPAPMPESAGFWQWDEASLSWKD